MGCHQYFCHQHFCCRSQNFYKSKRIKPQNSKIILDGNDSRSCLNPLPNGQTGKLYQTDDLEGWRQFARSYMLQTSPKWDPKDKNNQKKGTGTAHVNFQTPKLKAKDFILGNKEHEKLLMKMGIQIMNEEATYPPEQEDAFRFVSILANEMPTLLAGPAQFGNNFKKGPLVGSIAKSNPLNGCTDIINCKEISGKIAVLKRGECMFAEKVKRVEDCGSIGAIIMDNQPGTSGEGQNAIFSMAGDGLTEVEIGSAFLPSKESDVLLKAFAQNRDVTIAISHTRIDVHQLHKNISTEQSPMDNTLENDLNSKKVFTSKEILENQELLQKENNSSEIHDEL